MEDEINVKGKSESTHQICEKKYPAAVQAVYDRIHILKWIPQYTKVDFISDFIAGITVGLTMMPQAIAYAALADLPAQYGLYTAFIGSFAYVFFGTIKEVSIGPTSLMALLVFSYTEGLPIDYIILLCLLCGIVQLLMGVLKLGFLVDFIPIPVTSGFQSATSVTIILTQMKGLLGIRFKSHGVFDLIKQLVLSIPKLKPGDSILGLSCVAFLLTFRSLTKIPVKSKRTKKILWLLSISRNALLVFITSIIAFIFEKYSGRAPFRLSGNIQAGLPSLRMPNFSTNYHNETIGFMEMTATLGSGIIVVPIVGILANVAIAKAFALGTVVDATQEMITLGICNILGSFVQAMPACGAFTRSAVSSSSGIRTPMGGIYAGAIILLALSFLTPYFYYIPRATLSAILISAVMFMVDYQILGKLWRCSKFDLIVVLATFCSSMVVGVEMGLMVGVSISILSLLRLWTRPTISTQICPCEMKNEYLLIKPEIGLLFPGVDYFVQEVTKLSSKRIPIVVDFANVLKVDYTACEGIKNLIKSFQERGEDLVFVNISKHVYKMIESVTDKDKISLCDKANDVCNSFTSAKKCSKSFECDTPLLEEGPCLSYSPTEQNKPTKRKESV